MSEIVDRNQLKERLAMKLVASSYKRLPKTIKEDQLEKAKKYMEELQANSKIIKGT